MKRFFPDVNVWFALAVEDYPYHHPALAWWDEERAPVGFCRLTQIGLLRLLTTAPAMGGRPVTNEEAWGVVGGFLSDDRVRVFPELPPIEERFRALSGVRQPSPKLWVDAYLAAYAAASEAVMITFDRAFTSHGIECRILR